MRNLFSPATALTALWIAFYAQSASAMEYTGRTFPDPFADPLAVSAKPDSTAIVNDTKKMLSQLTIQGILVSPGGNMAIINGKVAKAGTLIQGFQIISIESNGVSIESSDHTAYKLPYNRRVPS